MSGLTDFLRARLDEEATRAEAATHGPWRADLDEDLVLAGDEVVARMWDFNRAGTAVQCAADTTLITVHADPTRVLREVKAKRRAVDAYAEVAEFYQPNPEERYEVADGNAAALHGVVSDIASIYADHPDFKEEWRP